MHTTAKHAQTKAPPRPKINNFNASHARCLHRKVWAEKTTQVATTSDQPSALGRPWEDV